MTRRTRRLSAALAAALTALLLAGCGDEPAQAGAAAVVGDERITTSELADVVDRGLESPEAQQQFSGDRAEYQRRVLNRMVRAELLERAAADAGVEVTQGDVDQQLARFAEQAGGREALEEQAAAGGIAPQDLPVFVREVVLELTLGDELTRDLDVPQEQLQAAYEQNRGQFERARSRHILVEDEALARQILAEVQAQPDRFAALAAQHSTDPSNKDDGGDLGWQGRGRFVPEFDDAVFTQPVGTPFLVQTQFGWHVVLVEERDVTTLEEARPELRRTVLGDERSQRVAAALRETAEEVGVEVNPRFGTWDAEAVEVVPADADDGLSSPAPSPGAGGDTGETGGSGAGTPTEPQPSPSS